MSPVTKLYDELAGWWPLLSPYEQYAEEAAFFIEVLSRAGLPPSPSLLELGSGGGNNAFYLKQLCPHPTLTDISPQMLAVSARLNPDCEHIPGDMRTLRLGRHFDVVFIHDAIDYMTTREELAQALATAAAHCKPGGLALFVPDALRETFEPSTEHGGHDGGGRALRYMEWSYDPDQADDTYEVEYVYVLREGARDAHVEHERHTCGLFARAVWLLLLEQVGFHAESLPNEPYGREPFLARRDLA